MKIKEPSNSEVGLYFKIHFKIIFTYIIKNQLYSPAAHTY